MQDLTEWLEKMWWIIGITIGCRFHNRMTASDEDPVSRGKNNNNKKKDGGGKGNKKEDKKNKTEKKEATKEPKNKAEGKASKTPPASSSTNAPAEKKNKGIRAPALDSFSLGGIENAENVQHFYYYHFPDDYCSLSQGKKATAITNIRLAKDRPPAARLETSTKSNRRTAPKNPDQTRQWISPLWINPAWSMPITTTVQSSKLQPFPTDRESNTFG